MKTFIKNVIDSHRFFVRETPKYIAGHRPVKWRTKRTWSGADSYWYYPLNFKEKLRYPIAYFKFMWMSLSAFSIKESNA